MNEKSLITLLLNLSVFYGGPIVSTHFTVHVL